MPETESHLAPEARCPVIHGPSATEPAPAPAAQGDRCPVPTGMRRWIARFGVLGVIAFFTIKGLAWLIVPGAIAWMAAR